MNDTMDYHEWTDDQLQSYMKLPHVCFSGETCGLCKATANVLHGSGWLCLCGHCNTMLWAHKFMTHEAPTYGPTAQRIRDARPKESVST